MSEDPGILVIDDQETILQSFAALLEPSRSTGSSALDELELALGGSVVVPVAPESTRYRVSYARQGDDGVAACKAALADRPFSLAFVDIVMPPGMDGVETAAQLWRVQPDLEIVLCTAHSTYSWQQIMARLPKRDQLVILRKPFDPIEVRQLAACLSEKWRRGRALASKLEQLEAQVASEVSRRMQIELQRVQKFESLGRLAAGIAHEINTPTQYIQSSLEFITDVLADAQLPPELAADVTSALADATEGIARVTAIVRSVRDYAHTSHKEHEAVDLNRQIRMAVELARSEYKHDAEVILELDELPPVSGHADELGRAILNLIVNATHAIRARPKRKSRGRITVRTHATGDCVTVAIADTGIGIPAQDRDRIFEPFFTTKPLGHGTGQGLAIVRATVVDRHHGSIDFDSVLGEGTEFRLTLPTRRMTSSAHEAGPPDPEPVHLAL